MSVKRKLIDIMGQKFGKWTVVGRARSKGEAKWNVVCDCGNSRTVAGYFLRSGATRSCGCKPTVAERMEEYTIPEPNSGCLLWAGLVGRGGYGTIKVAKRMRQAHRVAWEIANGPVPDGMHVCHKCDVRCCVNPDHLWLGTNADNVADRTAKGRGRVVGRPGESNPVHKLTASGVLSIRAEISEGRASARELAKRFGVARSTIDQIVRRRAWTSI